MDSLERKGYWWVPEEPETKLAGVLRFDGVRSSTLELFGAFRRSADFRTDIIFGETSEAECVTLCDCVITSFKSSSSTYVSVQEYSTLSVQFVFLGDYYETKEDVQFHRLSIRYFNLEEWARTNSPQWIVRDFTAQKLENRPPEPSVQIDDLTLSIKHRFMGHGEREKQLIEQTTYVVIESAQERNFFSLYPYAHTMHIFLSLATTKATNPVTIECRDTSKKRPVSVFLLQLSI